MIQKIQLTHQLKKETSDKINTAFQMKEASSSPLYVDASEAAFFVISLKTQPDTNVCQIEIIIDYLYFNCKYELFASMLYKKYHEVFGDDIVSEIPSFDECVCTYVEYTTFVKAKNAKQSIEDLSIICKREYLNRKLWNAVDVHENEIVFLLHQKNSYHLQALAKCYSSALVKLDQTITGDTKAVSANYVLSLDTERSVFEKMINDCFFPAGLLDCKISDALLKKAVYVAPIENDKTVDEIIAALPRNEYRKASLFLNAGERINLITKTRYSSAGHCWKCSWHLKKSGKPPRALFMIDFHREHFVIKANLSHLGNYVDFMEKMPDTVTQAICKGYDCKRCNMNCGGGWSFTFRNKQYSKCVGLNYVFKNLSEDDCGLLASLILKESEY